MPNPSKLASDIGKIPQIARGQVWCTTCGNTRHVDGVATTLGQRQGGWPKCCGYTMTIDSPEERAAIKEGKDNG